MAGDVETGRKPRKGLKPSLSLACSDARRGVETGRKPRKGLKLIVTWSGTYDVPSSRQGENPGRD